MRCLLIKGPAVGMPEHYSPEQWAEIWPRVQINTAQELKVSAQFCGKFYNIWISAVHKSCHCFFAPLSTLVPKLLPHAILGYLSYQRLRKSWSKMAENGLKCISNTTLSLIVIISRWRYSEVGACNKDKVLEVFYIVSAYCVSRNFADTFSMSCRGGVVTASISNITSSLGTQLARLLLIIKMFYSGTMH